MPPSFFFKIRKRSDIFLQNPKLIRKGNFLQTSGYYVKMLTVVSNLKVEVKYPTIISTIQLFRQLFKYSAIPSSIQVFSYSTIPSSIQVFSYSTIQLFNYSTTPVFSSSLQLFKFLVKVFKYCCCTVFHPHPHPPIPSMILISFEKNKINFIFIK